MTWHRTGTQSQTSQKWRRVGRRALVERLEPRLVLTSAAGWIAEEAPGGCGPEPSPYSCVAAGLPSSAADESIASLSGQTATGANPYHNYEMPSDVNGDGVVTPLDLLLLINKLQRESRVAAEPGIGDASPEAQSGRATVHWDVHDDRLFTPLDLLRVINDVNRMFADTQPLPSADPLREPTQRLMWAQAMTSLEWPGSRFDIPWEDLARDVADVCQAAPEILPDDDPFKADGVPDELIQGSRQQDSSITPVDELELLDDSLVDILVDILAPNDQRVNGLL